jgi:hypothetical protein
LYNAIWLGFRVSLQVACSIAANSLSLSIQMKQGQGGLIEKKYFKFVFAFTQR